MNSAEARIAILQLYAEYNRSIDAGDVECWLDTFTESGSFHHPTRAYIGPDELREFIVHRSAHLAIAPISDQRHWNDSVLIEGDEHQASARCQLLVSGLDRKDGTPLVLARGSYSDRLEKTPQGWRFSERRLTLQ